MGRTPEFIATWIFWRCVMFNKGKKACVKRAQDPTIEQFSTIPTIEKSPSVRIIEAENLIRLQSSVPLEVGLESDSEELD